MKAPRIVLDANVIVSAVLFGGPPADVIRRLIEGAAVGFTSMSILNEVRDVLQRPKFGLSPEQALTVVEEIHALCRVVKPAARVRTVAADPDDDHVLACAAAAEADVIVTGDRHLLAIERWRGTRILPPARFLQECMEER